MLVSCEITDTVGQKAGIMRLYPSQTAYCLTLDDSLVERIEPEGQARELSWVFPADAGAVARRLSPAQRAAATKLLPASDV